MTSDDLTMKIHQDNGVVWYTQADAPAINSGKNIIGFMLLPALHRAVRVRILGTAENAHIICALFAFKLKRKLASVELGSPQICTAAQRASPERALLAMRSERRAGSLGGWHEMGIPDYNSYALVSHIQKIGSVDLDALSLLKNHPAWKALSFVKGLDQVRCCQLLNTIIDPRWYIDPKHPARVSKLNAYLGLTPSVAMAYEKGQVIRGYCNYQNTLLCWKDHTYYPQGDELKLPENFLWRIRLLTENRELADLRANQVFVAFLRHSWLDALYANKQHDPLFVPEHFFKLPQEVEAFKQHMTGGDDQ